MSDYPTLWTRVLPSGETVFPYHIQNVRADLRKPLRDRPDPASLAEFGVFPVADLPMPDLGPDQRAERVPPAFVGGAWVYGWQVVDLTPAEIETRARTLRDNRAREINRERDRRLGLDFVFNGETFQRDAQSLKRITGAGALALGAMVQGAQPGNFLWHGRETPFVWIASNDTLVPMDAQTCYAFAARAAAVETELVFAAKALREMDPIPDDFTDDKYWPGGAAQ